MSKVLFIFLDGIGIGEKNAEVNPFFKHGFKTFTEHFGGIPHHENRVLIKNERYLFPVDARLGVEGIPQSGTGQASIFGGFNAPELAGRHYGPFPFSSTIPVLHEENIFRKVKEAGKKAFFANAYPKVFFDYLKSGKNRLSVTSLSYRAAGFRLNSSTDVRAARALTAEITSERWVNRLHYRLPILTPEGAAKRLLRIAGKNDFTLYEYYLSDHLGHGRLSDEFLNIFTTLDKFLFEVIRTLPEDMTLFIVSDHGNLEDTSVKQHTLNSSLAISAGVHAKFLYENIRALNEVRDAVLKIMMH